tara:strand:- start:298 stop:561 length:264 start_codon:yes stop_codon:yes gene_type:complete
MVNSKSRKSTKGKNKKKAGELKRPKNFPKLSVNVLNSNESSSTGVEKQTISIPRNSKKSKKSLKKLSRFFKVFHTLKRRLKNKTVKI